MSAGGNALVSTGIVVVGQWAKDRQVTPRIVIGGAIVGITLSVLAESEPDLAGKFSALVLMFVLFTYGPAIAKKFGLYSGPVPRWG